MGEPERDPPPVIDREPKAGADASPGRHWEVALKSSFESEARMRGSRHVFVTSFTFQAPGFYQRLGYREIFRWESVPTLGRDDVHMRKDR
jgi:hypothetical protein